MRFTRLTLVPVVILVAACSSGGAASAPASAAAPSEAAPSEAPSAEGATRIEVSLTDALRIEPAEMTVPAGVPMTFVVTNRGATDHEFLLGDEAAQAEHEQEMDEMGGMTHDEPDRITLGPGATKELTYTFAEPGQTLAGCHLPGHYDGGMKATITITG